MIVGSPPKNTYDHGVTTKHHMVMGSPQLSQQSTLTVIVRGALDKNLTGTYGKLDGGLDGNLTGNLHGNLTGDLSGNLNGNLNENQNGNLDGT